MKSVFYSLQNWKSKFGKLGLCQMCFDKISSAYCKHLFFFAQILHYRTNIKSMLQLGEIAFVDLVKGKEVGGTYVTEEIQKIELFINNEQTATYLLVSTNNLPEFVWHSCSVF